MTQNSARLVSDLWTCFIIHADFLQTCYISKSTSLGFRKFWLFTRIIMLSYCCTHHYSSIKLWITTIFIIRCHIYIYIHLYNVYQFISAKKSFSFIEHTLFMFSLSSYSLRSITSSVHVHTMRNSIRHLVHIYPATTIALVYVHPVHLTHIYKFIQSYFW